MEVSDYINGLQWFLYCFTYDASGLAWLPIYTGLPTPTPVNTIYNFTSLNHQL